MCIRDRLLSSGIVDGLIIGSTLADAGEIDALLPEGFPVVFVDRTPEHCVHDSVIISNYTSMFDAVTTLKMCIRDSHCFYCMTGSGARAGACQLNGHRLLFELNLSSASFNAARGSAFSVNTF